MWEEEGIGLRWSEYRGGAVGSRFRSWVERGRFLFDLAGKPAPGAVVLVQKVLPPASLVERWKRAGHRVIYDFDDALHEHFSWGESEARARRRRRRFDRMLDLADQVVAGSPPLAAYVRSRGRPVAVLYPSLLRRRFAGMSERPSGDDTVVLGWIGNAQSQRYLKELAPTLLQLFAERPDVRLCVCSSEAPTLPEGIRDRLSFVPWSEAGEIETLSKADVAISPMGTEPWSRARGGRVSVLLSMAAGLPVCAAPGGGLQELVGAGDGVRFVDTPTEWLEALRTLVADPDLRGAQGAAARAIIDAKIWADVQYPRLQRVLFGE